MNDIRYISTLILVCGLSVFLFAQDYIFDAQLLKTEDGLANLMTNGFLQDSNGFIWIGTSYGLNRYDGYQFQLFTKEENGLQNNTNIHKIQEDKEGNLWLFYQYSDDDSMNIDIFNPHTQQATSFDQFFSKKAPFKAEDLHFSWITDYQNRLWLSTKEGRLYNYHQGIFSLRLESTKAPIQVMTVDEQDNIWIGKEADLWLYTPSDEVITYGKMPGIVNRIYLDKDQLWVTTRKDYLGTSPIAIWAVSKDTKTPKLFNLKKGEQVVLANKVVRNQNGFWYTRLNERLVLFDEQGEWLFDFHTLLAKGMETGFFYDLTIAENTWFTTPIGLLKTSIKLNPFTLVYQRPGKLFCDCRSITEDEKGFIYFLDAFVYCWKPKNQQLSQITNDSYTKGNRGLIAKDSSLWIGLHSESVLGMRKDLRTHENFFCINNQKRSLALAYHETTTSNFYLIGKDSGLSYLNYKEQKEFPFEKYNGFYELKDASVNHFHKNKLGIWLATDKGLFLLDEEKGILNHFNKASGSLPFDFIQHTYEDENGVFWLATKGGGIIRWEFEAKGSIKTKSKQITTSEGLADNFTYAIYGDDYGKLWISSDKGLMCLDKATLKIRTYTVKDGLPHNEFNASSHYQAADGTLYFGGLGGIISFHPKAFANLQENNTPLAFIGYSVLEKGVASITDRSDLIQNAAQIIIKPTDKFARLDFSLLDYEDTKQHAYAYKIEGYSEQWNYINENYVPINSLPYGKYQLKVKGRNSNKGWSNQELSLDIIVQKPFYLQIWFISLMVFTIAISVFAIVKRRLYTLQRDREQLEKEVKKRTKTILKQTEQLKELDKAKTRFFSNITHEFRTPLTLVIGPLEQVMEKKLTERSKGKLSSVLKNARHLLGLINQLLDLSKLESGQMKVEVTHGDINVYTKELANSIKPLADKKEQSFELIISETAWKTQFDKKKWTKIIYNLLSNAIKYTPEKGAIQLELMPVEVANAEQIHLRVQDSGIGIKKNQLTQIFNRFYQVDDSSTRHQEGTGIGLALIKELVELQGGSIEVFSEHQKGTTFDIKLPIYKLSKVTETDILPIIGIETLAQLSISEAKPVLIKDSIPSKQKEQLEILIIEDNAEMRTYIRDCLDETKYHIREASNGTEGITRAIAIAPDLIISDVMMPGKNGFEVTETLRSTISTSHIPIVLLTAKSALESRLIGFQSGADVYLTKPFSPRELSLRIQKLIEIRELIRNSVSITIAHKFKPTLNEIKPPYQKENHFVKKVRTIIEAHLNTVGLNGEFIGQQTGMSRMQIHRKLRALMNQSASELIREVRLQKAYELLQTQNYNSSEVAYQTGFNTLAYFSKTFKEKYGYSPSDLVNKESA